MQPDGTTIPQSSDLQDLFDSRSDPVDAVSDAARMPQRFVPDCTITFEVLMRDADFNNAFGWYNVTGSKPQPSELHTLLGPNDGPGSRASLDIRDDSRYAGGEIGFWLKTPEDCPDNDADPLEDCGYTYFSERQYNEDNSGDVDPWLHLLIYDSKSMPESFYFAWEDLFRGGDNDFSDIVTIVENIVCSGAGGRCDTGMDGICSRGTMQCRSGSLECVQARTAGDEQCNALDDDCDGDVDEGNLCPEGERCRLGKCEPECGSFEFRCSAGLTCVDGVCIDDACVDVSCEQGEVCREGECVAPCAGVTCPKGQRCSFGSCIDPCAEVDCDEGQVCEGGVCKPSCECRPCADGLMCAPSGRCRDSACLGVDCPAGEVCEAGECVDACEGASCPRGQRCELGQCVAAPRDGGVADGGGTPGRDGGPGADASASLDAGSGGGAATGSGCGCRASSAGQTPPVAWALVLLWVLGRRRRR